MKLIIDMSDDVYEKMKILSEMGMVSDAVKYILDGKIIPDDAEVSITIPIQRKEMSNEIDN